MGIGWPRRINKLRTAIEWGFRNPDGLGQANLTKLGCTLGKDRSSKGHLEWRRFSIWKKLRNQGSENTAGHLGVQCFAAFGASCRAGLWIATPVIS